MEYAYYLGCFIPARLNQYDLAIRTVMKNLGVKLTDLEKVGCCGTVFARSINIKANLVMSARILSLAKNMRLNLLVPCPGCYESLIEVENLIKTNGNLKEEINNLLKSINELIYEEDTKIKHLIQVLYSDIGLENLKNKIKKPLNGLRVAVHYGCHILRPSNKLKIDNAENPKVLDELVNITGAESIYWPLKLWCCGSPILAIDKNLSLRIAGMKLKSAKESEADCIITICPSCQIQFDALQNEISEFTKERYDMPILLYPQLLGLAMGFLPEEVGLNLNRVAIDNLLKILSKIRGE